MLHCAPFSSFAASPPNFATTFHDAIPLLFHSNFLSWQMHSLTTLAPYVSLTTLHNT